MLMAREESKRERRMRRRRPSSGGGKGDSAAAVNAFLFSPVFFFPILFGFACGGGGRRG